MDIKSLVVIIRYTHTIPNNFFSTYWSMLSFFSYDKIYFFKNLLLLRSLTNMLSKRDKNALPKVPRD